MGRCRGFKVGYLPQVGRGVIGERDKVATHLAEQDGTVGDNLHLVHDTRHGPKGVGIFGEQVTVGIGHLVGVVVEEVATRYAK